MQSVVLEEDAWLWVSKWQGSHHCAAAAVPVLLIADCEGGSSSKAEK